MNAYDAIIIGTGQAGPALAERLAKAGTRVAIIERGKFGGTCVNNGCTPTKTLVASAYVARLARRAAEYGVDRKSTRLNSSHRTISYAVFCLKKTSRCLRPLPGWCRGNSQCACQVARFTARPATSRSPS